MHDSARRIAIITLDTRGGIQPYIALALGLQQAGHHVRMLAPSNFIGMIEAHGLWVSPLTGDIEAALRGSAGAAERGALASIRYAREQSALHIATWMRESLAACEDVDLVVGGIGGMIVGQPVAEKLGVPFVQAHLQPVCGPTTEYPGVLFPGVPRVLGALGRRLSHSATEIALWTPNASAVTQARREVLGLPGARRTPLAATPVFYGYSHHVVPRPRTWSAEREVTGYWSLPDDTHWSPDPRMRAFIRGGPAPVCIGFGSMSSQNAEQLAELVTQAVRKAGVRAVLLSGWGGLSDVAGDDIFVADEAPHRWLFPQMAAVVHHGGAGTTGAACAAGVPSIVVPFTMDQPFWGARIAAIGVGPAPIPRRRLSCDNLAQAIRSAVSDDGIQRRAMALGEAIRAEDGVGAVVAGIGRMTEGRRHVNFPAA